MAVRRRGYSGLKTTFGAEWGRLVTFGSTGSGGQIFHPDGSSPDDDLGLLVLFHGYGGDIVQDLGRLRASVFRACHFGGGWRVMALRGTFTDSGSNRTWFTVNGLLPRQTSFPWAAATVYAPGDRRTAGGFTYNCIAGGTSALPAPSGSGTFPVHAVVDGGGVVWRCTSPGTDDRDIKDIDFIAGPGRVGPGGLWLPEGVVPEFLRTSGCRVNPRRIELGGYSTGGGAAHAVLSNRADLFSGAWDVAGCGFSSTGDVNYAAPTRRRKRLKIHGINDVTVNVAEVPPASSAAVSPHPSAVRTLEDFMVLSGHAPGTVVSDTGTRVDFESTAAGSESELHAPPADPLDEEGNPVRHRYLKAVMAHVPSTTGEGHRFVTNFIEDNPGAL